MVSHLLPQSRLLTEALFPVYPADHFKEICPAGHGYTYLRSDVQISLRQLEEEDLQSTGISWDEQSPAYPQPSLLPSGPQLPQTYPETPEAPLTPQEPLFPLQPAREAPGEEGEEDRFGTEHDATVRLVV